MVPLKMSMSCHRYEARGRCELARDEHGTREIVLPEGELRKIDRWIIESAIVSDDRLA
jgi:hypothetical protein